ncbi:TolC family protein [Balneola vulgaris]|uniref:TolC family protein n=1 Tax=Balneola vulgaris TaxID=287535 RepID=UPI00039C3181|nr:TolC family protein [Balneola vulgaris]
MRRLFQNIESYTSLIKLGTTGSISSPKSENYEQFKKANLSSKEQKKKSPLERGFRGVFYMLIILLLSSTLNAQNLESYQQEAAQNNPELKASFNRYLSELENGPQVGALPDPEVAFAYFISPIETRVGPQKARVSVTQMFPWFGSLSEKRLVSEANAKAQFEQFQEQRNRIFYQMEMIWSDLFEVEQQIRIAEEHLSIINTLLEVSLSRYENGLTSQVDVLRAQIEQEDLKTQIELLKDNRGLMIERFNEFRNVDKSSEVIIPDNLSMSMLTKDKDDLRLTIIQKNPNLNKLRYREEASKEMVSLADRDGKPSFGIGFDYIATGERSDVANLPDNGKDAFVARASFKIPLFRNKYNAKVQQAELNLNTVQQDIITLENKLETDLLTALRDRNDAQRRFNLYHTKQIQRVEQAINILMESYSTDASDFEEILRLQRKLLEYQLKRIQASADLYMANSYINYLMGVNNISENEINY